MGGAHPALVAHGGAPRHPTTLDCHQTTAACSRHEVYNKGMGAWNSAHFEPCLGRIVPQASRLPTCVSARRSQTRSAMQQCTLRPNFTRRYAALLHFRRTLTLWWWSLLSTTPHCKVQRRAWGHLRLLMPGGSRMLLGGVWVTGGQGIVSFTARNLRCSPSIKPLPSSCNPPLQPSYNSVERRAFEQLLRQVQSIPSQPSVLLLQVYPWWQAFGDGVTHGLFYREPESEMTVMAQASGRPSRLPCTAPAVYEAFGLASLPMKRQDGLLLGCSLCSTTTSLWSPCGRRLGA